MIEVGRILYDGGEDREIHGARVLLTKILISSCLDDLSYLFAWKTLNRSLNSIPNGIKHPNPELSTSGIGNLPPACHFP